MNERKVFITRGIRIKESDAVIRQRKIDFEKAVWEIVDREAEYNDEIDVISNFIIENANKLHEILNKR